MGRTAVAPPRPLYSGAAVRPSTAIRAAAVTVIAAGVAAPLARRRLKLPAPRRHRDRGDRAVRALRPRPAHARAGRRRLRAADVGLPRDVQDAQRRPGGARAPRPDRLPGAVRPLPSARGTTPTLRLQRRSAAPAVHRSEQLLVWSHWLWFLFPHGTVAYLLLRHPERFPRGAAQIYATFDLGLIGYWAVPTAPPWYAAQAGRWTTGSRPSCGA